MEFEQIKYEVNKRVGMITLNRPEKLNAFTSLMKNELIQAFDQADQDDEVRVVIVTGAGRAFCAGADLSGGGFEAARKKSTLEEHRDGGGLLTLRIFEMKKPMIAAINGAAVGVGITMTLPMIFASLRKTPRSDLFSRGEELCRRLVAAGSCRALWESTEQWNGFLQEGFFRQRKRLSMD